MLKVDAEKIRNLLTSQQSDLISDGAASLIQKLQQKLDDVKYYQDETNSDNEKLIAGYTYQEVADKLEEIYRTIGDMDESQKDEANKLLAKAHIYRFFTTV